MTSEFFYRHPEFSYLMLGVPVILILFAYLSLIRTRALTTFCGPVLQAKLGRLRSPVLVGLKAALLAICWMLATLALMDPVISKSPSKEATQSQQSLLGTADRRLKAHDVLLLIDTSASMAVGDASSGRTRLAAAQEIADNLLAHLKGESVALYAFTSEATPLVPATWDYLFLRLMLRQLNINEGDVTGTDIKRTLEMVRDGEWHRGKKRQKTLILFSDGGDTLYESLDTARKAQRLAEITQLIKDLPDLQVITIGLGSHQGGTVPNITQKGLAVHSSLDPDLLKALVQGRGAYLDSNAYTSFEINGQLLQLIEQHTLLEEQPAPAQGQTVLHRHLGDVTQLFYLPLVLSIILLLAFIYLPEREERGRV